MTDTNCDHVCHTRGLNPWIDACPMCGCPNPKYDENAIPDILMPQTPDLETSLAVLLGAMAKVRKQKKDD